MVHAHTRQVTCLKHEVVSRQKIKATHKCDDDDGLETWDAGQVHDASVMRHL